ncbi:MULTISPECIES: hypothetical protein [Rhodoplanes]|uniref:Uncharacterized protein n=1 Tax=Rhodoplanes serenus TaxID=200615 RepID=A0A327JUF4_9BRAD|nr:hypothetical protein [Rhodoplanes serenus]RAI29877.1 hypothetical protein CH340_22315 [Rhodoplanes serenus]VCU08274.1 hypothetical protein RHODGE_RHODGE_02134 [Rhodoplanes serenus]
MTFTKIALFAFGLLAMLATSGVDVQAAARNHTAMTVQSDHGTVQPADEALFDRAKGSIY